MDLCTGAVGPEDLVTGCRLERPRYNSRGIEDNDAAHNLGNARSGEYKPENELRENTI